MSVTIYSTPTCGYCRMAKSYLYAKNVPFTEVDVSTDQTGLNWILEHTGQAGVPVLNIEDEIILGFDRPAIDDAIQKIGKKK